MFRTGDQIGPYILVRKLGRGGFGEVWLAERRSKFVTTKVAVKLPLDDQVDHEAVKQEATLWEKANGHPNILPILEADEYDGQVVIVSEYAPGGSLEEWLRVSGSMTTERAVEVTIQILDGLDFLHSRGIVHRDLKPANILLQGDTPRLGDFGISRAMLTSATDQTMNVAGTVAYMAPEALDGKRSVQTDLWSVGVNLYRFLTGRLPFPQAIASELFNAILMKEPVPLPDTVPGDLALVVGKSLSKLPENRYHTAAEMRRALKRQMAEPGATTLYDPETRPDKRDDVPQETKFLGPGQKTDELEVETKVRRGPVFRLTKRGTDRDQSKKATLYAVLGLSALFIVLTVLYMTGPAEKAAIRNDPKTTTPTSTPTPTPAYDIPDIQANVEYLKLFESAIDSPPIDERKYSISFATLFTRYVNFELSLKYVKPGALRHFEYEHVWYKGNAVIRRSEASSYIDATWTGSTHTGGIGWAKAGNWNAGSYRLEIIFKGRVIASKDFEIREGW